MRYVMGGILSSCPWRLGPWRLVVGALVSALLAVAVFYLMPALPE